jgi:multidrug efflux pump subunit AcrB
MGMLAYLAMPREQDPEINFNWVMITTVLPGASAEDVEKRVTKPLEDAIKGVADIRFVMSSSRENVATILVRFRDIDERLRQAHQRPAPRNPEQGQERTAVRGQGPAVIEITTSNGFPTAMVLVTGQAADELLRSRSRQFKDDLERIAGVDQVFATGLRDPELQVEFDPVALANRGLTAADVADSVNAWFRDTFAGKVETAGDEGRTAWLVRIVGQTADPEELARIPGQHRDAPRAGAAGHRGRSLARPRQGRAASPATRAGARWSSP